MPNVKKHSIKVGDQFLWLNRYCWTIEEIIVDTAAAWRGIQIKVIYSDGNIYTHSKDFLDQSLREGNLKFLCNGISVKFNRTMAILNDN